MKFETATIKEVPTEIIEKVRGSMAGRRGIFFYGKTGTGKTYTMHAMNNWLNDCSQATKFLNWAMFVLQARDSMKDGGIRYKIDEIREKEFIFIDDLGAENATEWSNELLYNIVNSLYENERVLFMATNLPLSDFAKKYGERILSRLAEMCVVVTLDGVDRRLKK